MRSQERSLTSMCPQSRFTPVARLFAADTQDLSWREAEHAHLSVEVQRVMTRPGVYRYHCTIHPDVKAALN